MNFTVIEASTVINAISLLAVPTLWRYPSIFFHECGHALAAIAVGSRVRRFAVGEGEVLWRARIGGVETLVGLVPSSGMVGIEWVRCSRLKFLFVILAGPAANALLAYVAFRLLWATELGVLLFMLLIFEAFTICINLAPRTVSIDGVGYPSDGLLLLAAFKARKDG